MSSVDGEAPLQKDAADAYVQGLAALGAPTGVDTALAVSRPGDGFAEALSARLKPRSIVKVEYDVEAGDRLALDDDAYDLIAVTGVLGAGDISDAVRIMRGLASALALRGRLALVIKTYATRVREPGVGRDDVILFPELAGLGYLGDEAQQRTALTPAGWLNLIECLGLRVDAIAGYGEEPPQAATLAHHVARLAPFDANEIGTGRLLVIATLDGRVS